MELGSESLSEDELNKLQTVEEYRQNGLSGRNGEHPFLMKGLQTASIVAAEGINRAAPSLHISEEAALRFPIALFGTFISLLLFHFASELFGKSIGLVTAALRAVEPMAVGFDRIAKEDTLVLFFFLLCSLFFVKGQTAAERGEKNWLRYMWAAAASFGGLMASKYYPHLLGVMGGYYNAFLKLPNKRWGLGKPAWLKFFVVMGVAFVLLNPTILLPDTWREMLKFSSENRIGHDSYEYLGALYPNKMSAWLAGVPWTFYYVFIAVKTPLTTLVLFLIGLPLIFVRRYGDGRLFLAVWAFMWFLPFTFLGGKFTRYFTLPEPLILIVAAVGFCAVIGWLGKRLSSPVSAVVQSAVLLAVIAVPAYESLEAAPHYRLFTNVLGGGTAKAGTYFPHDEFYDTSTRDIVSVIAAQAGPNVRVACETPGLFEYYANKAGRADLVFISLSDPKAAATLEAGDIVVDAFGRKYRSNAEYLTILNDPLRGRTEVRAGGIPSALVFVLDGPAANAVRMKAAESVSRN
jgi:4-amino-4-deoxy-L-arabinose transferase-like glycosyltransferase